MITKIEVDGFKSLKNFELELRQGLNILVGPNGSGKTNIALFFEFLAYLTTEDLSTAVSKMGGAGAIFSKRANNEYITEMKIRVQGLHMVRPEVSVHYEYDSLIGFPEDLISFKEQQIKIKISYKDQANLSFAFAYTNGELKPQYEVTGLDNSTVKAFLASAPTIPYHDERLDFWTSLLSEHNTNFQHQIYSLHDLTSNSVFELALPFSKYVRKDFIEAKVLNVIPGSAKKPEDIATLPGIKPDGSGLYATLYAMKKQRTATKYASDLYTPAMLKRVIANMQLVNNSISKVEVENDSFNNRIQIKVFIKTGDEEIAFPFAAMSDGTVKWTVLITAILTAGNFFSLEEPENYLHPWMQAEIVNIIRDRFENKPAVALLTTHSESLINYAQPEELIIVSMHVGRTIAKRVENIEAIKKEIMDTGFSLGYYYFSNALTNE